MATINRAVTKSFRVDRWLGLREAPDGDDILKYGEAAECRNWRITKDGKLRRRPGTKTVADLRENGGGNYRVRCLWSGMVCSSQVLLAAADGKLWSISQSGGTWSAQSIGSVTTTGAVSIFGFGGKAYILTGAEYKVFDGQTLSDVAGYVPIVSVAVIPSGGGTLLEAVNKLTTKRRVRFSPDGSAVVFHLPESGIASVDSVTDLTTGQAITGYTADCQAGTFTLSSAPAQGVSTIEAEYTASDSLRAQVTGMRFAEMYNGSNDNRIFLYGDGSNKLLYSGIDNDGTSRADYFPDLNEVQVGASNTPVTGVVKHYSKLAVFKQSEAYTIAHGTITLADGTATPAFYLSPVNRSLGNEPMGQVQIVLNSPRTLCAGAAYEWKNNSSYTANLTIDERQAKRISDRIAKTLDGFTLSECVCFDDNETQEYYIVYGSTALVHNYAADAWYSYTHFPASCIVKHGGDLYFGDDDGYIHRVSDSYSSDDGTPVLAYWESGAWDFGTATRSKYLAEIWALVAPTGSGKVSISARTERNAGNEPTSEITTSDESGTFDFSALDFGALSFDYDRMPISKRMKLRVRKFTHMKLMVEAVDSSSIASVSQLSMTVVYGGESH